MPHLRPGSQVSKSIKKKEEEFILYLHHPSETKATTRVPPSVLCIVFLIYIFQKATLGSQQRWVKSTRRVLIIPMYPLSPQHIASSTVYIPSHGGALVTLVNLHWLFIIPKVHVYIRVHFSAIHLMGLDKCIMTCIHHPGVLCAVWHTGHQCLSRVRNPGPLQWRRGVLTTEPPGKTQTTIISCRVVSLL